MIYYFILWGYADPWMGFVMDTDDAEVGKQTP